MEPEVRMLNTSVFNSRDQFYIVGHKISSKLRKFDLLLDERIKTKSRL